MRLCEHCTCRLSAREERICAPCGVKLEMDVTPLVQGDEPELTALAEDVAEDRLIGSLWDD